MTDTGRPLPWRFGALAVLVVSVAACGDGDRTAGGAEGTIAVSQATAPPSSAATEQATTEPKTTEPTAATEPTATTAPVSVVSAPTIVLGRDGLGVVRFGEPADEVIGAVTAVLGEPDEDSGWVEPLTIGACAGSAARYVAWGALYLYFSDESPVATGPRHLFGYSYGRVSDLEAIPEGLATPEGIGLGTTVEFLRAAYPGVVVEPGEEGVFAPSFYVDEALSGRLTGADADDLVTMVIGGDPCGLGM